MTEITGITATVEIGGEVFDVSAATICLAAIFGYEDSGLRSVSTQAFDAGSRVEVTNIEQRPIRTDTENTTAARVETIMRVQIDEVTAQLEERTAQIESGEMATARAEQAERRSEHEARRRERWVEQGFEMDDDPRVGPTTGSFVGVEVPQVQVVMTDDDPPPSEVFMYAADEAQAHSMHDVAAGFRELSAKERDNDNEKDGGSL